MSNWGDPLHGVCCYSFAPPALSLSGLVDVHEFRCPLAIRDQHLTGFPFTHTHYTSSESVHVIVSWCVCAGVLARWGTALSKCHHRVSVNQCCASHPHSRFVVLCRRLFDQWDDRVCAIFSQKQSQASPARLSVHLHLCLYLALCLQAAVPHLEPSMLSYDPVLVNQVRHCSYERSIILCLCAVRHINKLISFSPSW